MQRHVTAPRRHQAHRRRRRRPDGARHRPARGRRTASTVTLADAQRDIAERGRAIDRPAAAQAGRQGQARPPPSATQILARIQPADLYGGELEAVDFVVEAATENVDDQARDLRGARPGLPRRRRSWRPTRRRSASPRIGAAVTRPERVIGMHFMNPPPLMKLVEIIRGLRHRRTRPTRPRARWPSGSASRRSSRATSPASSSTAC